MLTRCPHCASELTTGLSHKYLMRCTNFMVCGRYVDPKQ